MMGAMEKLTIEQLAESETPYLDVFGVESRPKGRPAGAYLDYDTSLELPAGRFIKDRAEAMAIRSRVRGKALAVVQAIFGEEVRAIYKAELALEMARLEESNFEPRPGVVKPARKKLLSEEEAKMVPGSGLVPGETYWNWMQTYALKSDEQWAAEKLTVKANLERIMKGGSDGS